MATFPQLRSEPKRSSAPPHPLPAPRLFEAASHHSNASFPFPSSSLLQLRLLQPKIPQLPAPQQPQSTTTRPCAAPPPPHLVRVREISSTAQLLMQAQSPPFAFQIGFPPPLITCNESSDAQVAASYFSDHLADNHPAPSRLPSTWGKRQKM